MSNKAAIQSVAKDIVEIEESINELEKEIAQKMEKLKQAKDKRDQLTFHFEHIQSCIISVEASS